MSILAPLLCVYLMKLGHICCSQNCSVAKYYAPDIDHLFFKSLSTAPALSLAVSHVCIQSIFLHHCEYWAGKDRKGAYKMLKKMLSGNFEKEVEMPFTEAEAELWGRLGPNSHKCALR